MPNAIVEAVFVLGLWVPPVVVAVCALMLFVKAPSADRSHAPARAARLAH